MCLMQNWHLFIFLNQRWSKISKQCSVHRDHVMSKLSARKVFLMLLTLFGTDSLLGIYFPNLSSISIKNYKIVKYLYPPVSVNSGLSTYSCYACVDAAGSYSDFLLILSGKSKKCNPVEPLELKRSSCCISLSYFLVEFLKDKPV